MKVCSYAKQFPSCRLHFFKSGRTVLLQAVLGTWPDSRSLTFRLFSFCKMITYLHVQSGYKVLCRAWTSSFWVVWASRNCLCCRLELTLLWALAEVNLQCTVALWYGVFWYIGWRFGRTGCFLLQDRTQLQRIEKERVGLKWWNLTTLIYGVASRKTIMFIHFLTV
jgi:hypothetical protein